MRRNNSETSLEAYHTTSALQLQEREKVLMTAFKGRANSLLAKKVLCVRSFLVNPDSGKRREMLGLFVPEQLGLFQ